jgi:hypothetical protein
MKEPSPFRVVERYVASAKNFGDITEIPVTDRPIHNSDVLPTDEDVAKLMAASLKFGSDLSLGYNREYAMYRPIEMQVQSLRAGRLPVLLSRIGLDRFAYDTIETYPASTLDIVAEHQAE